jgi:hypothetical protein
VEPSPVGIQSDGFGGFIAAAGGTFGKRQLRMRILLLMSDLLGLGGAEESGNDKRFSSH